MEELTQGILSELQTIKWLLVVLVVVTLHFTFYFFYVLNKLTKESGAIGKKVKHKERSAELEEMLAKGDAVAAKFTAQEWTISHPNEPWAHWYLAKAYDQLGDFVETKKSLVLIQKISPTWNDAIEPWLLSIEEHLTPKGI